MFSPIQQARYIDVSISEFQKHAFESFQLSSQVTQALHVIVPQYGSSKITVFIWGKNIILKFLGNTK